VVVLGSRVVEGKLRRKASRDDGCRDGGEPQVVVAGVAAQQGERLSHVQLADVGDDPLAPGASARRVAPTQSRQRLPVTLRKA
jgi:hypothetical protein